MSELVFACDPAAGIRRRALCMLFLAASLWALVTFYLPCAALGFTVIAFYFRKLIRFPERLCIEVSLGPYQCLIRRFGEDEWTRLKKMPSIWSNSVFAPVPERIVPFGMLWLSEPMLGASLFRDLRSRVSRAEA